MSSTGELAAWADSDSDGSIKLQTPLKATSAKAPVAVRCRLLLAALSTNHTQYCAGFKCMG